MLGRPTFLLLWLWAVLAPAAIHAQTAGEIVEVSVPAPALAGNLVGTPTTQAAAIYLPPGYRGSGQRHYPVVYMLHGIADSHATWLRLGLAQILDRLIAAHRIPEAIVVLPDGGNIYGGGYYRNSPVTGNWADYVANDLRAYVESHYRTLARPGGRAIIGWSMGGYGAINLAMTRPGLFSVAYGISPCCLAPIEDLGSGNGAWGRALAIRSPSDLQAAAERHDFYAIAGIGILAAFSPAPDAPPFFYRAPYRIAANETMPDGAAYDSFVARFPLARAAEARDALRQLRGFGFDYGIDDQYAHIPPSVRAFSSRLAELRIPHRFEVYEGDHRAQVPARLEAVVLPWTIGLLDPPQ